ncbi:MAG: putative transcriptional regulator [Parcubacteria group bacterium GW2011_GWA2_42_14]|nr:MAG: putative transcriptional regulator [Parcubacteria group bacterium GW2011_GWA2_42_14]
MKKILQTKWIKRFWNFYLKNNFLQTPMKKQIYFVNKDFQFFPELRLLALKAAPANRSHLLRRLNSLGGVKLAILAGIFINSENSRADLLLVGDKLKKARLNNFFSWLESEIGKELNYVVMPTEEFKYRMDMYDRFVRDILEYPHKKLINKMHI